MNANAIQMKIRSYNQEPRSKPKYTLNLGDQQTFFWLSLEKMEFITVSVTRVEKIWARVEKIWAGPLTARRLGLI